MKLKNSALQELYDTIVNGAIAISVYKDSPIDKAFRECDEKLSESCTFEHINYLQERNDDLERSNKALLEANFNLGTEKGYLKNRIEQLEKDLDDAKETLNKANADREELQKNLDYYFNKYRELKKDYETVMKKRYDLSKEVIDLKARLNSVYGAATCTPEDYHKDGMYEVWRKLREVADATSLELLGCFADVCMLEDLIKWDLEDFMDEYKLWQEKLVKFCKHHRGFDCPLAKKQID